MSIRVLLHHRTRYRYDRPVTLGPHEIRLKPAPACRTPVSAYEMTLQPRLHTLHWYRDAMDNHVARVVFPERAAALEIDVRLRADLATSNPFDFLVDPEAERYPFAYAGALRHELAVLLAPAENGEPLHRWLADLDAAEKPNGRSTIELLVAVNRRVAEDIAYVTRPEHGVQACGDTLRLRRGSCRDSAWLLAQLLRHLGFAARFVSGYLIQLAGEGPAAPKTDRVDLHAWAEAYVPGAGWIGLDPTSGLLAAEGHIPLARSSAPVLAAPVIGSVEPCRTELDFTASVQRLS